MDHMCIYIYRERERETYYMYRRERVLRPLDLFTKQREGAGIPSAIFSVCICIHLYPNIYRKMGRGSHHLRNRDGPMIPSSIFSIHIRRFLVCFVNSIWIGTPCVITGRRGGPDFSNFRNKFVIARAPSRIGTHPETRVGSFHSNKNLESELTPNSFENIKNVIFGGYYNLVYRHDYPLVYIYT